MVLGSCREVGRRDHRVEYGRACRGRWAGQLGQGDGFSVFSWNPLAYNDSFSDSDTVMTSRGAK